MSENLNKVLERASMDAAFRAQLGSDPEAALTSYNLTAAEKAALKNRDMAALSDLGVDERVTKQVISGDDGGQGAWPNTPFTS